MVSCHSPQGSQHKELIEQAIQQVTEETIGHRVSRVRQLRRVELLWHAARTDCAKK